jgi:hypothetical protein
MKTIDNILIIAVSLLSILLMIYIFKQDNRIKELEVRMDEQQLIDTIAKHMIASRLNINIR